MRNRAGKTTHFLFNYSGETLEFVSETAGSAPLRAGRAVYVGQPLRRRRWARRISRTISTPPLRWKPPCPPETLLDHTQRIELQQGRVRKAERWGPRTLDLDIMLFGDAVINSERLTVPHYDMKNRGFMLWPLFEIAPDLHFPDGTARRVDGGWGGGNGGMLCGPSSPGGGQIRGGGHTGKERGSRLFFMQRRGRTIRSRGKAGGKSFLRGHKRIYLSAATDLTTLTSRPL